MNDARYIDNVAKRVPQCTPSFGVAALKPKGACWYCNHPLDNVRKFCNKDCADDYRIEEEVFNDLSS